MLICFLSIPSILIYFCNFADFPQTVDFHEREGRGEGRSASEWEGSTPTPETRSEGIWESL